MERVDREYAIIYIDREGETLKVTDESRREDFATNEMVTDYYNHSGFLQWNFYLIIPKELVKEEEILNIEENSIYSRKYVIPTAEIESFIDDRFPKLTEKRGQITLVKGTNWEDATFLASKYLNTEFTSIIPSWYRNESLMFALTEMDILRSKLIKNPDSVVIFYTHLSNEYSLAEKKFKLFKND